MTATFVAYIDESGDEGFSFGQGSSDWFVLSAVVVRKSEDLPTVRLVDAVRHILGKPEKAALHFRDLRHEQKLVFVDLISKAPLRCVSVLIHKPSLKEPEKFRRQSFLYNYASRFLLERVSWYCRDHRTSDDAGDGSLEVVFSNRSGMSYGGFQSYLQLLQNMTGWHDVRVDWSVVKPAQVSAYTPPKRMGLHVADAVASSFFYAVQPSRLGFTEGRYATMLKPVVYNFHGTFLGYGLKFWPQEATTLLQGEQFEWMGRFR